MSVISPRLSAQPVWDNKPGTQEKTWQRIELSALLCEFSRRGIEDVRRTCLSQKESLKLQQERLTALGHKLSVQRDKVKREEAEMLAQLSG
jgi:hypothetical protein